MFVFANILLFLVFLFLLFLYLYKFKSFYLKILVFYTHTDRTDLVRGGALTGGLNTRFLNTN